MSKDYGIHAHSKNHQTSQSSESFSTTCGGENSYDENDNFVARVCKVCRNTCPICNPEPTY